MPSPRVYTTLRDICGVVQNIAHHYDPVNLAHARAYSQVQHLLLQTLLSLQSIYANTMLLPACRSALDDQRTALAKVLTCYVHALGPGGERSLKG